MMPQLPPSHKVNDQYKIPRPKKISEVPGYLKKLITTFCDRFAYIVGLVWEASPSVVFIMIIMALFDGVMPVIGALIGKEILNALARAYNGELASFDIILTLLVLQFAYMFVKDMASRIYSAIIRIAGEIISNHIKMKILDKAKSVDISSYDKPDFYAKMENANREAGHRPIQVLNASFTTLSAAISMVSYIVVLFAVSPFAPFIIIASAIPATVINFVFRRKNAEYMFFRSKERRKMLYYSEVIVNKDLVKEMRIFGLSDSFTKRYREVFTKYYSGLKKLIFGECLWGLVASVLTTAVNCVLFIYIARGVFGGEFEVGNYALYTGALTSIATGVASIITTTASIYEGTLFINNMIAFMGEKQQIVPAVSPALEVSRHTAHTIEFKNVSFRYPGTDKDVLHNINLTINPAETVLIVGLNGAGKTTLIKLLTRLYDPTQGEILLDGHNMRNYDVDGLYRMFGIIFQDFGKYAVNVRENIAFGEVLRDIDDNDIRFAAAQSGADSFIERLPQQYDTPLMRYFDENALELSIGQWQKLAISRAFYSDSDILILDEPTASLDPLAEQEIFNQFDTLRRDKTSIFVSHRLSSATVADKIVVLENGEIKETGSHQQLMKNHGKYCELFTTQASRYQMPDESM